MNDHQTRRLQMVREQLTARGIRDLRVRAAMEHVPREAFVLPGNERLAYEDSPLGIGLGQTISQPYVVALMAEALQLSGNEKVLEIGTGSGYGAAVLGSLAHHVFTIERHDVLADTAVRRLAQAGFRNVTVVHGDGTLGLPAHAPFDAIVVTAGGPHVPQALLEQIPIGGRVVIPVGSDRAEQTLRRIRRVSAQGYQQDDLGAVRFVPLIGAHGWQSNRLPA